MPTGTPALERIMVNSVWEKTRLSDDFARRYLLSTNLLMVPASSSFMATDMEEEMSVQSTLLLILKLGGW